MTVERARVFRDSRAPYVLAAALLGISMSGPLVRLSHAHPLAIATWRLGFSLVVIAAMLVLTGEWRALLRLTRVEVGIAAGAGVMLAFHFWSWNASVQLTSVAASVMLVNMQPVVVAVLSAVWLHERPTSRQWAGIVVGILGAIIVASPDLLHAQGVTAAHPRAILGDILALVGAVTAAIYYVAGRRLRTTLGLWPYVALVYGVCLLSLIALVWLNDAPLAPQPPRELGIFVALALGPMLLGHTGLNWALKYSPAYVVNVTLLGEPIGATLIAALLPGIREVPGPATFVGGAVVLAGILMTARK
ncbi:MAG: DMT family transporter [Gemmatimonadota bacterium]